MHDYRLTVLLLATLLLGGCASRPVNEPIQQADPASGYRPYLLMDRPNNDPHTLFALSFSGGGTRAAALSYGVLEELNRTEIMVDGKPRRLIDEVDLITGVSGGSFTGLAYALYGDRLFTEYEQRFLKRNVQGDLARIFLNPFQWRKFIGGSAGRSDVAADYYDKILFEGATFADLLERRDVPAVVATSTDITTGSRVAFYQNDFDLLCTELDSFRLARAAAASSAVPVVLSAITLNNYGGSCGYEFPDWAQDINKPSAMPSGRAIQRYKEMQSLQNSKDRPYIHLVDGGVSDNIGIRGVLEALEQLAASKAFQGQIGFGRIERIVLIVVNARAGTDRDWDTKEKPPGIFSALLQTSSVPIEHYSYETIEALKDRAEIVSWRRELMVAEARLSGQTKEEAEASVRKLSLQVVDVSFDAIEDPQERQRFMELPTSFHLEDQDVDGLREVAGRLMRESADFRAMLKAMGAVSDR